MIVLYAVALTNHATGWMRVMNASLPALLGAVCLWGSYLMVRKDPQILWTPLPWFLVAWTAYYGVGPLVYVYGTSETVAYLDSLYPGVDLALSSAGVFWLPRAGDPPANASVS